MGPLGWLAGRGMETYLLVSGDFTPWGGMDRANYELAWHLADGVGAKVHLASHRVAQPLAGHPNVLWHKVPRPLGRHALAEPLLAWRGRALAARLSALGARVLVNGGNCAWPDVNWAHYVHSAWDPRGDQASSLAAWRASWFHQGNKRAERRSFQMAKLVLANSERTRRHVLDSMGLPPARVRTVYYGIDPAAFRPASPLERTAVRRRWGWPQDGPLVAFIGGLGRERRKGFDVLFAAWKALGSDPAWDAHLLVLGGGSDGAFWRDQAAAAGVGSRIHFLGHTKEVGEILPACDALVSPCRYEAYGLGVQEALCCGLPALVTRSAGVAERYPPELQGLLLDDPPRAEDLIKRLKAWRRDMEGCRVRVRDFGARLRQRTWEVMGREIVGLLGEAP